MDRNDVRDVHSRTEEVDEVVDEAVDEEEDDAEGDEVVDAAEGPAVGVVDVAIASGGAHSNRYVSVVMFHWDVVAECVSDNCRYSST